MAKFAALEAQIKKIVADKTETDKLWSSLDFNGNGIVSLAEIDRWVVQQFPLLNHKPALMRAYKKTCQEGDADEWVERFEFEALLVNLFYFNKVFQTFEEIDKNHDHRLSVSELTSGIAMLHLSPPVSDAKALFKELDRNHGGYILFDEFCAWLAERECPGTAAAHAHAAPKTVKKKAAVKLDPEIHTKKFATLEEQVMAVVNDPTGDKLKSLWAVIDCNNNGVVSLAEIDRFVKIQFPLLDHPRANMRAYQACVKETADGKWIERRDFKNVLRNLFYFNKLYAVFHAIDADGDNRIDLREFKLGFRHLGLSFPEKLAESEFRKIDTNHGGIILLDEFCDYIGKKHATVD